MASYELVFRKSVASDLRTLSKKDISRLLKKITALVKEPRPVGCEKLSGQERYRIRQGSCRVIYEIQDHKLIVLVVKVGHRREIYR